jgi:hypothetical protein
MQDIESGGGRPRQGYDKAAGKRLPSVTTVLSRFKESGGLIQWAFKQGLHQGLLQGQGKPFTDNLYATTDAASVGTIVHGLVDADIKGKSIDLTLLEDPRVDSAYGAYQRWRRNCRFTPVATEVPLVSVNLRVGGTPDCIANVDDELCIVDWKTSNSVYGEYLVQVAAYREMWNESKPEQPITGPFHLLRFSKENGDFFHASFPDLSDALQLFKLYREAYELDQKLQKRVK